MKGLDQDRVEIVKKRSEAFLMEVSQSIAQDNLAEYEAAERVLQAGEDLAIPESADLAIRQMAGEFAEKQEALKRAGRRRKRLLSAGRIAALVFLCVLVSGTLLVVCVDAFRIQLMDFLFEDHGEYMDVNVVPAGDLPKDVREMIPEDWDELFYPGWLPEGYKLAEVADYGDEKSLLFINEKKDSAYLHFSFTPLETNQLMVDIENVETKKVNVGKYIGYFTKGEGYTGLIVAHSGFEYALSSVQVNEDEMIRFAEKIYYYKLK